MLAFARAIPGAAPRGARCLSSAMEEAAVKTVGSGVKVGSVAMQGETATVTAWAKAGSRFETSEKNGVANLFTQASLGAKVKEIDELGGMVTGKVDHEHIVFEARVLKEHVPKATALLGELFKPGDISAAKAAVQGMVADAEASPEAHIMEHLHDAAFLNTAMGMPSFGTSQTVAGLSADDVSSFAAEHITGERVSVAVAGAFDQSSFENAANSAFSGLASGAGPTPTRAIFTGSDKRIRFDSMSTAHVSFAFESVPFGSPEMYPLMVMQAYLGCHDKDTATIPGYNRTSRLASDLDEQEAAPKYHVINNFYSDTGLFGISFQGPDNVLDDTMWYSLWNLVRMCHKMTDEEVAFAKTQFKARMACRQSTTNSVAGDVARSLSLAGRHISGQEVLSEVDKVTAASVRATAHKVIHDQEHALAAVGPIYELPDLNWIRRRSYWLRY